MNLKQLLAERAGRYGEKTAVVCGERRLSYAELDATSNKFANALLGMGVTKGDRVLILLANGLEYIVIYFGVAKVSAVAVPLDVKYKLAEITALIKYSQPKVLIAESTMLDLLVSSLPEFGSIKHVIEVGSTYKERFPDYGEIVNTGSALEVTVEPSPEDVVHIGYTSGPTSHPKGVMLTHELLARGAAISAGALQQTEKDVMMLFALPMHHVFGLAVGLMGSITSGSKVVVLTGLSINNLLELIERERGTIFIGVPYIYALLVEAAEQDGITCDLSSLRLCPSGGSCLPDDIAGRFEQHYGVEAIQIYGLTEATAAVTFRPAGGLVKLGSSGVALPGWDVKIVDDDGVELPPYQAGEVVVRGPTVMKGYYNSPSATARTIRDGWLHTGDIGKLDEDGYLFITAPGKKKGMIIVKGQNIWPEDIEEVLYSHPRIAEVLVVGVPDELRGEIVRAIIRLKEGETAAEEEMKRYCRERLANYKVPKQIVFSDSVSGKAGGEMRGEDV